MDKLAVEAKIIVIEEREGGAAITFQSDRQLKFFSINLKGDYEGLKIGDRVIVSVKNKPKKKRASKSTEV